MQDNNAIDPDIGVDDASIIENAALEVDFPELTDREREVAMQIVQGLDGHEISKALGISVKTYDTHRGHILKKLGCKNAVQLTRLAYTRGYLKMEGAQ